MGDILKELPIRFNQKKAWVKNFTYHIMHYRNKHTCGCCGSSVKENVKKCPTCKAKLTDNNLVTRSIRGYKGNSIYYMTTESNEGDLLFRYFLIWVNEQYGKGVSEAYYKEVFRYQVNEKGKWKFARLEVSSCMWYWDYKFDSELSIRKNDIHDNRYSIVPYGIGKCTYPKWAKYWNIKDTVKMCEVGRKINIHKSLAPMELFELMRKDSKVDTMVKLNRWDMLSMYHKYPYLKDEIFMMVRKNQYPDCEDYNILKDYWEDCRILGHDLKNLKYLNPEGIEQIHAKYNERVNWAKDKESVTKNIELYDEKYIKKMSPYMNLNLGNKEYTIELLPNIMSFYKVSVEFKNCVYRLGYYKSKDSFIFLVKHNNKNQQLCEIKKCSNGKFEINQLYGHCNKIHADYDKVKSLINSNLKKLQQVRC